MLGCFTQILTFELEKRVRAGDTSRGNRFGVMFT